MHIPDGFVSCPINQALGALALGVVGYGIHKARTEQSEIRRILPMIGATASFVFAAQMLNFPIGSGTSGHFLGGALAASLLGGWNACLVLASVLIVQCLAFADGGLSALGTNIVNMGLIGGLGAYALARLLRKALPSGTPGFLAAAGIAAWVSVVMASAACAVELAVSGAAPASAVLPAMVGTHALIGIGEAMITVAVLAAVVRWAPDLLPSWAGCERTMAEKRDALLWKGAGAGFMASLVLAGLASPFACSAPDGLEKVAENQGFLALSEQAAALWSHAPWADYAVSSISAESVSTALAGLTGTLLTLGFSLLLSALFTKRGPEQACIG